MEPDPVWERHLFTTIAAGLTSLLCTRTIGYGDASWPSDLRIVAISGVAAILHECFLFDSENYRRALASLLNHRYVDLTFSTCFLLMMLSLISYAESFLVEGESREGFSMLFIAMMVGTLSHHFLFEPVLEFIHREEIENYNRILRGQ